MTANRHRSTAAAADPLQGVLQHSIASGTIALPPNFGAPAISYQSVVPWTSTASMDDVVTPNFKKIVGNGGIINNPMTRTTLYEERRDLVYERQKVYRLSGGTNWTGYRTSGDNWWVSMLDTALPAVLSLSSQESLVDAAVRQAHANIELSQAAILASLGEGRETVASMVSVLKRAAKIGRAFKKLNIKALRSELAPKELADRYMELRYALRPLVYDAKQIAAAYSGKELPKVGRQTWRGYKEDFRADVQPNVVIYSDAGTIVYGRTESHTTLQVRAGVLTAIEAISGLNVWGADSILETVWELTPYSFVLDWIFDLGETLASFTPEMGVKKLASWVVTELVTFQSVEVVRAENIFPSGATAYYDVFQLSGKHTRRTSTVVRVPEPSRPILPQFRLKLDLLKLLDLAIMGRKAAHM